MQKNKLLILIIILAAFLRFFQLGSIPPSLNWDEHAHGYNAYSILKTARDGYGYFLPLSFRSFDDYKPPLYTYLVVPSVAAFGLTDFAVRFPSALLGTFAVLLTYLMVLELLKKRSIALLASFFLAISPWHIQFSRLAFETNSAIFWSVLGTWAFLKAVSYKQKKLMFFMSLSAFAFGANLFMYHNARVFVPLFTIVLLILYRSVLIKNLKYLIIPLLITCIYLIVLAPVVFSVAGQLRFHGTSVFGDEIPKIESADFIKYDEENNSGFLGKLIHNRRLVYAPIIIENYLTHLNPEFLFFTADMERHHAPLVSLLYAWDLPFILAGIYFLIQRAVPFKSKVIIFWWFLIAPVAASVTWGVPHSLRSEIYLPMFQIFSAIGVYCLYQVVRFKKMFFVIASLLLLLNFLFYIHQYYSHLSLMYSRSWLYGRKQAVEETEKLKNGYERVIVSNELEQPYMFWLYNVKYDPKTYQQNGGTVSGGFLEQGNKFDKYFFKDINYQVQKNEAKTLFVGTPKEFPEDARVLKKIYYLDGTEAILIVASD